MKRALIAALLLLSAFVVSASASDGVQPSMETEQTFEQKQANIMKMLDERIAMLQEGKACVQSAKSDEDLKSCREKQRAKMDNKHAGMRGLMDRDPRVQ